MRKVEVGMLVSWLESVLVGTSIFGGAASAQVESTCFEAVDGWVAGYGICGPEFAATCSYPITNACVPNDHAASQNCCEGDPNERTGWYMGDESQHCHEPHIDTVNPFSGLQHLRFQRDGQAGSPPGCAGNLSTAQCNITALTPRLGPQSNDRTVISFEIAGSDGSRSSIAFQAVAHDDPSGSTAATVVFGFGSLVVDGACDYFYAVAPVTGGGVFRKFSLELDPGANTARYCYAGNTVLLTKFGPGQARTVQGVTFRADNDDGVWDIDDFSITRGSSAPVACREFPSECQTPCGARPCAVLKGVAVNAQPIPPTTDVHVRPGDRIESEIRFSGWGGNIPQLRIYQARLLLGDAAKSGTSGSVLPLGWDAPLDVIYCTVASDCPPTYPVCGPLYATCASPNHDPDTGVFIATERPDFALFGLPGLFLVDVSSINFRFVGVGEESVGNEDSGMPRYAGTVVLQVSNDACGTFTIRVDDDEFETFLGDPHHPPVATNLVSRPLVIHVCADDGTLCDGVDFCDGACCDQWNGECRDGVVQADCNCPSCAWSGGRACADVECKAEFVVIPTVSQWGLVVLTLLLLTGAKIGFARRSSNGRTEGFKHGIRSILWRAYGMTAFRHFRLRVLHAFG